MQARKAEDKARIAERRLERAAHREHSGRHGAAAGLPAGGEAAGGASSGACANGGDGDAPVVVWKMEREEVFPPSWTAGLPDIRGDLRSVVRRLRRRC